jgi:peptidyl-prolyl cis-trans isomerase A (cyclophilin A)
MRLPFSHILLFSFFVAVVSATAAPPAAPTDVVAYAPNQSRVHLSWKDNATDETAYYVDRLITGADSSVEANWIPRNDLLPNFEVYRDLAPSNAAQAVVYRVAAVKGAERSAWVVASVQKPQGSLDLYNNNVVPEGRAARAGMPFSFQVEVYGGSPQSYVARDLPDGVMLNSQTGTISGTIPFPGVYRIFNGVVFDTDKNFEQVSYIRVVPGISTPVVADPPFRLAAQDRGIKGFLDVSTVFDDPYRRSRVFFQTSLGSFTVLLYDSATPKTVENFLSYTRSNRYNGSYLHRAATIPNDPDPPTNFIIQGGGAVPASVTATPTQWAAISKFQAVANEPGISNVRGTISLAKGQGNQDSATSEWFISTGDDNPAILDRQNGGFTVFGEVLDSQGMAVVDALNSLETANYTSVITGNSGVLLTNVPVLDAIPPATPGMGSLVQINSVTEIPPLVIELISNDAPEVVTAIMSGTDIYLEALGPFGTANLLLRATNLDGNSVDYTLPVRIDDVFSPGIGLSGLKAKRSGILLKGRALDDIALKSWSYRINRKGWRSGGRLSGTSASFKKILKGFKRGKNILEVRAFDRSGNVSQVLIQRFRLG